MKYWFDTEFIEYPCTIDLISIGMVAEDGREFYAESTEVDWSKAHPWVLENVRPHLFYDFADHHRYYLEDEAGNVSMAAPRDAIAGDIRHFMNYDVPEVWGWYSDYDWVVFCWLFGSMVDLPTGFPKFCLDLKQWAVELGNPNLPIQNSTKHNALEDARWTRDAWLHLNSLEDRT